MAKSRSSRSSRSLLGKWKVVSLELILDSQKCKGKFCEVCLKHHVLTCLVENLRYKENYQL